LFVLFLCSLVPWTIGNGMTPLLPIYVKNLGAAPAMAGYFLSLSYLALAAGTVSAGWLSDRLQRRKAPLIAAGLVSIPTLWLMGQVTNIWLLAAVSAAWYFCAGMSVTLINILAGLFAEEKDRGKVFGVLSLNSALGSLAGGLAMGPIADRWGFPAMFVLLSLFGLLWPITGLLLKDRALVRGACRGAKATGDRPGLGRCFYLLFLGSLAATVAAYLFIMGRSLVMDELGFGAGAISTTSAISEVPILPLPLLLGWLSDRVGRRRFLILGYLATTASLLGLTRSASLWHFWVTSILVTISFVTGAVGTALVADLVPARSLGRALSLFGATGWIAGILGCAGAGYAVQVLGPVSTFVAGAFLPLIAGAVTLATRQASRAEKPMALPSASASPAEPLPTRV
jgi:MFS family permease